MSTLHIFSKPLSYYDSERLVNLIQSNDKVLLVGDACYAISLYRQLSGDILVLAEDAVARCIPIASPDTAIEYTDFVDLTLSSTQSITW